MAIVMVLAVGCQARRPVPAPPRPSAPVPFTKANFAREVSPPVAAGAIPGAITVMWSYPEIPDGLTFEVWASDDLTTWHLATNAVTRAVSFPKKAQEFFKVRAVWNGVYSGWATTGE